MSIVRHDVESRSPPSTIPQPHRRRLCAKPDNDLHDVPFSHSLRPLVRAMSCSSGRHNLEGIISGRASWVESLLRLMRSESVVSSKRVYQFFPRNSMPRFERTIGRLKHCALPEILPQNRNARSRSTASLTLAWGIVQRLSWRMRGCSDCSRLGCSFTGILHGGGSKRCCFREYFRCAETTIECVGEDHRKD